MSEEHFDKELRRAFDEIGELRQTVAALFEYVEALEQRELLRVRGNQFCRLCNHKTHTGAPPTPEISEAEAKYHDANHALGAPADRFMWPLGFSETVSWTDVERQVERYKGPR